jgi:L-alanine-DL-glutamate epimerase-like enolase superfamily enzyme
VLTRRQSFQPWLQGKAVDIIQPDVTKCGGLSEFRRIAQMAQDHNIQVVPHGWNTAIGLAADLQISAFLPHASYVEYLTPCAYIDELPTKPFQLNDDGYLDIPDAPGLGIEIDVDRLRRFCSDRIEFR